MPEIQFDSLSDFLSMGGYGFFVWLAYLTFSLFLLFNVLQPLQRRKQVLKQVQRQIRLGEATEQDQESAVPIVQDPSPGEPATDNSPS